MVRAIYCARNPSDECPGGEWRVLFRNGDSCPIGDVKDVMLVTVADKIAHKRALINSQELGRLYMEKKKVACVIM